MRRCWDTPGRVILKCPAIAFTERSACASRSRICRRAGWLMARNTCCSRLMATMRPNIRKQMLTRQPRGRADPEIHLEGDPPTPLLQRAFFVLNHSRYFTYIKKATYSRSIYMDE